MRCKEKFVIPFFPSYSPPIIFRIQNIFNTFDNGIYLDNKKGRLMLRYAFIISLGFFILTSCQKETVNPTNSNPPSDGSSINLYFPKPADLAHLIITARVVISAPDMDTIVADLTVTNTAVTGTVENIPAGLNRHFEIFVYGETGELTYYGHAYSDVPAGLTINLQISLYPVSGTGTVIITGTFYPFPSSEGKIAFLTDYTGMDDVYIMNPDASGITNLTNTPSFREWHPRISPDRQKIAFTREVSFQILRPFIMNIDGSQEMELNIHPGAHVGVLDWSPDGQKLAVQSWNDGDTDIYIYDINTHELTQITFNQAMDWAPSWSPEGDWIAYYSDESGIFKIYLIRPDGTDKHPLNNVYGLEERNSEFLLSGDKIVFAGRDNTLTWDLFLVNLDGSNLIRLTNTPDINEFHCKRTPLENLIIFARETNNNKGIYSFNLQNNEIRLILDTINGNEDFPYWR